MAEYSETEGLPRPLGVVFRRFWAVGLVIILSCLGAMAYLHSRGPSFEAQAVVRVRVGADVLGLIESHLMGRDALIATAGRHGMSGDSAAAALREAVGLHELTAMAGTTLGLAPDVAGVVISVRLPEADLAARVANDLALQVLDLGQAGQLDANHDLLSFYGSEEQRLWQEIAALKAEMSGVRVRAERDSSTSDRPLLLLQDQYDVVRHHLAEEEVATRLAARMRASDFALLQRASGGQAVRSGNISVLAGLAGAVFLALAAAFLVERRPWTSPRLESQMRDGYRLVDDPSRPILGLPRFVVFSAIVVVALVTLSVLLR